ncbi:MAG TPA: Na/Pi cotransporter family protein [Candidatus Hydrogenedentes bacterium]|nr:Na/Pi cotransporter family protein [Candidatus Hydrogenedentota bacterium]
MPRGYRWARVSALTLSLLSVGFLIGCDSSAPRQADRISLESSASGDNQAGLPGQALPSPLRVVVETEVRAGLFGGKGSRHPVSGAEVYFEIQEPARGAVFMRTGQPNVTAMTGADGIAAANVILGDEPGDILILASVDTGHGPDTVEFRVVSGVQIIGTDLETLVGGTIPEFGIQLADDAGRPVPGVGVQFRVERGVSDSRVHDDHLLTNEDGIAVTSWRLGSEVKRYFAVVEILDRRPGIPEEQRYHVRGLEFTAMALNKTGMALELLGGLALFILGMKMMSGGLRRIADRRLKQVLQAMTRNRVLALVVGAILTAVVQSSSATTVMTVGFVNAGLMTLQQAIGVVFGANIGTTLTAQILAFELSALSYPAIALGLLLTTAFRKPNVQFFGEAVMGFGMLFLGMTTMSAIVKPLQYSPEFKSWFMMIDCTPAPGALMPADRALICILIGTATTMVIQSSAATVGLVLALCSQGMLSFYTAIPLVLGDNIGTTITAILASLGANRNAKRTALAHTLFNVIGASYMYVLLFVPLWKGQPVFLGLVNDLTPGNVFVGENIARHVANAHSMFNILNCIVMLPFVGALARLCQRIIPVTESDQEGILAYLEPHLLASPSLALQQAVKEVVYMLRRAQKSINDGCEFFHGGPEELETNIMRREEMIDQLQHEITAYLVELSGKELTPAESSLIPALIHAVNDAERIGDHSENLVHLARLRRKGGCAFTEQAVSEVHQLQEMLNGQFEATYRTLSGVNGAALKRAEENEHQINMFVRTASDAHIQRLEKGECELQSGVIFLDLLSNLERVGDHLANIAERAGRISQVVGVVHGSVRDMNSRPKPPA